MAFLFMIIFPSRDRNRCFPSFLVVRMQDLPGRFEEMAAVQCFLMAGCGRLLCLAQAQQLLRQTQSTLATRTWFCPHEHTPHHRIEVQGGQMTGVQGSG